MKFHQLPIGSTFLWRGERYCKSSPLLADHLDSGKSRMVPRSAMVEVETQAADAPTTTDSAIPLTQVEEALKAFESELFTRLAALEPPLATLQFSNLRAEAGALRSRLLAALRNSPEGPRSG